MSSPAMLSKSRRFAHVLFLASNTGKSATAVTATRTYHEKVIDHYENPRNVGSLDKNDPNVGTGIVGAPACGDVMKLQIKVGFSGYMKQNINFIYSRLMRMGRS